jgi:sigma-B regulation protein RsbU (phosphoserine phosphatase)
VGRPVSEILPQPDGGLETGPLFRVLRQGERHHVEQAEIVRWDGSRIPVEYVASPMYDMGRLTGAVLAVRDLRDRLENRRAEQELQAASRVQQFLYPRTPPTIPGFDVAGGTYPSARVCGDYFDFIPWGSSQWCLTLGDVSGHGLGPALQMVETRAFLRATLQGTDAPGIALQRLNQVLCVDLPEGMFVSLFIAQLCAETRRFRYSSAGHPAGLMRNDGRLIALKSSGFLLGLMDSAAYSTTEMVNLHPGDTLVITSDGVSEMISPQRTLFGSQRLWQTVAQHRHQSAVAIRDAIHAAALEFAAGEPPHDDVTILVAKCLP